jgi:hypothetical protein
LIRAFFQRRVADFKAWWNRPPTIRDRVLGSFVGAMAGLWVAVLGRLFLGDMPVSFAALAEFAMIGAACGVVLGAVFPKSVLILGFPFASLGVGS